LQEICLVKFLNLHYRRITNDVAMKPLPKMTHKIEVLELSTGEVSQSGPNGKLLQIVAKWCQRNVESPDALE
jgi:hypothetical protein